jgi:tetratricopeptide (TPR) repeat protein
MYFETDPRLTQEQVLAFGERLRADYYPNLPGFADAIKLLDQKDLYPLHAEFLSRLGMTFSHGDYAQIDAIEGREEVAERLFRRALAYHPDHRSYLGLGILQQKQGGFKESIEILSEGVGYYPDSEPLHTCLGISYMNVGEFRQAVSVLERFQESDGVRTYLEECLRVLAQRS